MATWPSWPYWVPPYRDRATSDGIDILSNLSAIKETDVSSVSNQLGPLLGPCLLPNERPVRFDCAEADIEVRRNLGVRVTQSDKSQDLLFAVGERAPQGIHQSVPGVRSGKSHGHAG